MPTVKVNEVFYSLQGEGANAGRPAIFVRFSGCNLWSGRQSDKQSSPCYFCDTDFVGGITYEYMDLVRKIYYTWVESHHIESGEKPLIIFTGGEPTLQLTDELISNILTMFVNRGQHCEFAIETNGTTDYKFFKFVWVTMSPKTKNIKRKKCDELKVLYPMKDVFPEDFDDIEAKRRYLQPIDNDATNIKLALDYCLSHPKWSLSLQLHKILGII